MKLLGDWNWYLPRWLEWLPRFDVGRGSGAERGAREPLRRSTRVTYARNRVSHDERQSTGVARGAAGRTAGAVVDDHAELPPLCRGLLTAEGFDVVGEADDGASALALAAELEPDLVAARHPAARHRRVRGRLATARARPRARDRPRLEPSRREYGPLIDRSGALGFLSKDELSGAAIEGFSDERAATAIAPPRPAPARETGRGRCRRAGRSRHGAAALAATGRRRVTRPPSAARSESGRPRRADDRCVSELRRHGGCPRSGAPRTSRFGLLLVVAGFSALLGALHDANARGRLYDRRADREPLLRADRARSARVPERAARLAHRPLPRRRRVRGRACAAAFAVCSIRSRAGTATIPGTSR